MIVKGGARAGAGNLAAHLEKNTNERVSVVAIDGLAATDIRGALKEIMALTAGTACRDGMYHASISPEPGEPELTVEQRARAVEVLAEELGLTSQPRIVVEHEKTGESGITRIHQHIVFGRVDEDGKTISDFNNYAAHERAARRIEIEFGHRETPGVFSREEGVERPTRTPSHAEWQHAERSGLNPKEAQALLTELWQQSDSGRSFVAAAAEHGFTICRGDKTPFLVTDEAGDHVRLSRRLPDRAAEIARRMSDVDRLSLPTLDEARAALAIEKTSSLSPEVGVAEHAPAQPSSRTPSHVEPDRGAADLDPSDPQPTIGDGSPNAENAPVVDVGEPASAAAATRGSNRNTFADETPRLPGAPLDPPGLSKGIGIAVDLVGRVAEKAIEVAADAIDGLLGLFLGVGVASQEQPKFGSSPAVLEPHEPPGEAQPAAGDRHEVLKARPVPAEVFTDMVRARLSADDIGRLANENAQRANSHDVSRTRDCDMDR